MIYVALWPGCLRAAAQSWVRPRLGMHRQPGHYQATSGAVPAWQLAVNSAPALGAGLPIPLQRLT
jgi:hypothetical protein